MAAAQWLPSSIAAVWVGTQDPDWVASFTTVAREAGSSGPLSEEERDGLENALEGASRAARTRAEAARVLLLVAASRRLSADAFHQLVASCYRGGDTSEREAVLRTLPLLPGPERFLAIARDGCRTHILPLFEAIACENPYPARFFPEDAFNQLVLKAVFLEVPLRRIDGLRERWTPELARMGRAYASERAAAGRTIPDDLALIT